MYESDRWRTGAAKPGVVQIALFERARKTIVKLLADAGQAASVS
jgi:hypothetical protein